MNPTSDKNHLLSSNIQIISQLINMLERIDTKTYAHAASNNNSTIGAHTRHTIEFYQEFMMLLADDACVELCYDNRKRDLLTEHSIDKAIEALGAISTQFKSTTLTPRDITLTSITVPEFPPSSVASNIERELMYLLDHANHHMAIIKILAEQHDITFDDSFGVAGATLVYQKQSA